MNIKDIAKLCGVSPSTVSKILHKKDADISTETRKKVLEVIKKYQYVPYSKVIHSAAPKTNTIGVMLSADAYGTQDILYHIEEMAAENGYSILLCNTAGDRNKIVKCCQVFENKGVDGIISINQDIGTNIENNKIPLVYVFDKDIGKRKNTSAVVMYELKEAGYLAASYLMERGHERIGCLLGEEDVELESGYLKAYKEKFMSPDRDWIFKGTEEDIINIGLAKHLNDDITAIICKDVETGNMIYGKLREWGDGIPDMVSVISARDSMLAEKLFPKMTAVHMPVEELGKAAVEALVSIMEGKTPAYECSCKLIPDIIERGSVTEPLKNRQRGKIVVIGSMNTDFMINVNHIPTGGETVRAGSIASLPGGKGANQAVGAGKLGGLVYMIGRLGNDSDGKEIYNSLVASGVKTDGVVFDDSIPTGKAYINVAEDGESTIVIYPGANGKLSRSQVRQYEQVLDEAVYCLLTLEISEEIVEYAIQRCRRKNVKVILKPASAEKMKESLFGMIDYFIPNEKEVARLIPGDMTVEQKAEILIGKGVKNVIITLGSDGCYLRNGQYRGYFPAADFHPLDTTGAADAFISAFAVALSEGDDILKAISFASYAAGISITRQGVQPAMVDRKGLAIYQEEIESMAEKMPEIERGGKNA